MRLERIFRGLKKHTWMTHLKWLCIYDYADVEVEHHSLHEFPVASCEVGQSFVWSNTTDADESHQYDKEITYVVGNELTVTNCSEWSICGGLSATHEGVGVRANI